MAKHAQLLLANIIVLMLFMASLGALASTPDKNVSFQFTHVDDSVAARQASVYHVTADQLGLIWLATDTDGLIRYDGNEYQLWSDILLGKGQTADISKLDVQGDIIWAGTWGKGLFRWDSSTQNRTNYLASTDANAINDNRVQTLFSDSSNRLWIGTLSGLNYIEKDSPSKVHSLPETNPLSALRIWWLLESEGALWVATANGLFKVAKDLSWWQRYLIKPGESGQSRSNEIRTIELINDSLWVGTDQGLFIFNHQTEKFVLVDLDTQSELLANTRINDILPDALSSSVLIGTNRGLLNVDSTSLELLTYNSQIVQLPGIDIRNLFFDEAMGLWVGTREQGLFNGIRITRQFTNLMNQQALSVPLRTLSVKAVHYSHVGDLWLATEQGVFKQSNSSGDSQWQFVPFPADSNIHDISLLHVDRNDNLWVGTNDSIFKSSASNFNHLAEYLGLKQLNINSVRLTAVYEDNNAQLTFGTWGHGIIRYLPTTNQFEWVDKSLSGLHGNTVYSIFEIPGHGLYAATRYSALIPIDGSPKLPSIGAPAPILCTHTYPEDTLWMCSNEGLWRVNINTGSVTQFSENQGFPSKHILGITNDDNGFLWVITHQGLIRFNPKNNNIRIVGITNGLSVDSFPERGIVRSNSGMIVIASAYGAFQFDPTDIAIEEIQSHVRLSKILLGNSDFTTKKKFSQTEFSLPFDHPSINLEFSITYYRESDKNLYRYRLGGDTGTWSEWRRDNKLLLASLSPGVNIVEVEGKNSHGLISPEPLTLKFKIDSPWWMNGGIIFLFIGSFAIAIYGGIRWRTHRLASLTIQLEQEVAERTQQLEAANQALERLVETDYLTGVNNRRGFVKAFTLTQQQRTRTNSPLSILLVDVDYFKQFNDKFGHQEGDECLKTIAATMANTLRTQDVVARWGGEEFAVLLPNTDEPGAIIIAEKLRTTVEKQIIEIFGVEKCTTLTIGIASGLEPDQTIEVWLKRADKALYQGKKAGRNQVVVYK